MYIYIYICIYIYHIVFYLNTVPYYLYGDGGTWHALLPRLWAPSFRAHWFSTCPLPLLLVFICVPSPSFISIFISVFVLVLPPRGCTAREA